MDAEFKQYSFCYKKIRNNYSFMKRTFRYLFQSIFLIITVLNAQDENILARVNNDVITIFDFKKQFELSPMVFNAASLEEKKKIFLLSMTAQKLWAAEAENFDPLKKPLIKYSLLEIENKLARDILYEEDILKKISISNEELKEAIARYKMKISALVITADSKPEIDSIYTLLNSGIPFDSLLVNRPEFQFQTEAITVEYGQMQKQHEDIIFNLAEKSYSEPLLTEVGWVIFYCANRTINFENTSKSSDEVNLGAKRILESRKIKEQYTAFNKEFLGGVEVSADVKSFNKFTGLLWDEVRKLEVDDNKLTGLSFYEIYGTKNSFTEDELQSSFIKFESSPVSLIDFIGRLGFEGIKTEAADLNSFRIELSRWIKNFIRLELIAREARKRGYNKLPAVVNELKMWKDNYLYTLAISSYSDSVKISEDELNEYIKENTEYDLPAKLYKVEGLITPSLEKINRVLIGLDKNESFPNLIREIAEPGDSLLSLDFAAVDKLGEFASTVRSMIPGDIYGPINTNNSFAIIKLVDTSRTINNLEIGIESQREGLKQDLYFKKLQQLLDSKTVELANKFGVEINLDLLKNVSVTNLNIVVMRSFGFGEKMLAAPLINSQFKWYEDWLESKKVLP